MSTLQTSQNAISPEGACRLLHLPIELQLTIYELVVLSPRPLLLNSPCNSSYRGRREEHRKVEDEFKSGTRHPPLQPALTMTCRFIRAQALPLFYETNVFRATYCHASRSYSVTSANYPPLRWLRMIGEKNRRSLRQLYFYDRNESQDIDRPKRLEQLQESCIFTELGGKLETFSNQYCCAHLVTFAEHAKRPGEVHAVSEPNVPRLRLEGEE